MALWVMARGRANGVNLGDVAARLVVDRLQDADPEAFLDWTDHASGDTIYVRPVDVDVVLVKAPDAAGQVVDPSGLVLHEVPD